MDDALLASYDWVGSILSWTYRKGMEQTNPNILQDQAAW
jgi:hypothetical protein